MAKKKETAGVEEKDELVGLVEEPDDGFDKSIVDEVEGVVTPPGMLSHEWASYVVEHLLEDDELENGNPIRDGLMRVAENVVGPLVDRQIVGFNPAHKENFGTATVHIRLTLAVTNEAHPAFGIVKTISEDGIADVNSMNTPNPFNKHQSSSASTKAEAQALRKILKLRKAVSADEVTPDDMQVDVDVYLPETPASPEQITLIDVICKRTNMSVLDFINAGEIKYAFVEQVPSYKAQSMIKFLTDIQSEKRERPTKKPYDVKWRELNASRGRNESTD